MCDLRNAAQDLVYQDIILTEVRVAACQCIKLFAFDFVKVTIESGK